jgi:hypothetical protein
MVGDGPGYSALRVAQVAERARPHRADVDTGRGCLRILARLKPGGQAGVSMVTVGMCFTASPMLSYAPCEKPEAPGCTRTSSKPISYLEIQPQNRWVRYSMK